MVLIALQNLSGQILPMKSNKNLMKCSIKRAVQYINLKSSVYMARKQI
jgi:hypothetical protein